MRYEIYATLEATTSRKEIRLSRYYKTLKGAKKGILRFLVAHPECDHWGIWDNCKDDRIYGIHCYEL